MTTGQLGTANSLLANIELGFVGFTSGGPSPRGQGTGSVARAIAIAALPGASAIAPTPVAQSDAPTPKGTAR